MERAPARFGIERRFAAHDPDDRVQRDEAGAGEEGQVRQVEEEVAGAAVVETADLVDESLEIRRVELSVERQDGDRDGPLDRFDRRA